MGDKNLSMFRVIKNLNFCYGHRLLHHPGKCAHLHGHNAQVQVELSASRLNEQGMVIDFEQMQSVVQAFLDLKLDHKMILCRKDPLAALLKNQGEPICEMEENPTAENLAKLIFQFAKDQGLPVSSVKVWETPSACAEYEEG